MLCLRRPCRQLLALVGATLVELYAPGNTPVWVNPAEVVTVREPQQRGGFVGGVMCVITLANGNIVSSTENCETVIRRLR